MSTTDKPDNNICGVCLRPRFECRQESDGPIKPVLTSADYSDWQQDLTELLLEIGVSCDEIIKTLRNELAMKFSTPGAITAENPLFRTFMAVMLANSAIEQALQNWDRHRREGN